MATYKTLQVELPTEKETRCIYWEAIPLNVIKPGNETLDDDIGPQTVPLRSRTADLIQRLQANRCQLCGSQDNCEVHHVRKLANLKQRMIALHRKTIVVCRTCHVNIHAGKPTPNIYA